jgi:hypothetical protein
MQYAWDIPSGEKRRLEVSVYKQATEIDLMQVGNLPPFKFRVCGLLKHEINLTWIFLDFRGGFESSII